MKYRYWLAVAVMLFAAGVALGVAPLPGVAGFVGENVGAVRQLAEFLASLPAPLIALLIFVRNASTLLLSFVFSPLLILLPVFSLVANGAVLSAVSVAVVEQQSFLYVIGGILPHGIIELPAFFIGEAAALAFGGSLLVALVKGSLKETFMPLLKQNLVYIVIALGLLLIAAVIETFVTPLVLKAIAAG